MFKLYALNYGLSALSPDWFMLNVLYLSSDKEAIKNCIELYCIGKPNLDSPLSNISVFVP